MEAVLAGALASLVSPASAFVINEGCATLVSPLELGGEKHRIQLIASCRGIKVVCTRGEAAINIEKRIAQSCQSSTPVSLVHRYSRGKGPVEFCKFTCCIAEKSR